MRLHLEHTFTTYTKHYYIGSERINSKLGTVNNLGLLCEEMGPSTDLINEMNDRANGANKWLEKLYHYLDKELEIATPYLYSTSHSLVCGFKSHNPKMYDAYWYHPDHLGSSSFITNTTGEISQHLEYLPFGETLVEEHLNSYNSPFKFNGKEFDAETGNYYYGARYMNPKWSMWLGVDPLAEKYPSISPFAYVANNPIKYIDPDGKKIVIPNNTKDALTKLAQIAATNVGQQKINRLIGSKNIYTMNRVFLSKNSAYDRYGEIGRARTIYYPSSVWRYSIDGGSSKSVYVAGHEINHAYNHDMGFSLTRKEEESSSVNFGNYLMSVYGEKKLRTSYFGLGLNFSDNPNEYNIRNEEITNFTELFDIEAGGRVFLGFSYEKSQGGDKRATEYIISIKDRNGTFQYQKYTTQKDYEAAANRINEYQRKQNEGI